MDLSYSPEYEAFRTELRGFLEANRSQAPGHGGNGLAWQKLLIGNGDAARTIPQEYGGYGGEPDILKSRIIAEEFARAQLSPGLSGQGISMLVPTLRGEMLWCQGYSEPNAGSDLAAVATKGVLEGDHWVINGQKIWTSTAHLAHWIFCLVRTEPDAPKHEGISFLLFDMKTPGIEIRPLVDMTGAANFNEVFFTDVRVPAHQIVGRRGEGWKVANAILRHERGSLADPNVMQSRLNALIDLMKAETLDGSRVIDNPVYRDRLMTIQGRVQALRCNDLRLLSAAVNRQSAPLAGMVVKLQGTELRHELEGFAVDVLGELGLLYGDTPRLRGGGSWQRDYMYFLGLIIGGGTSQIQKNIIAERGLDMPREPKPAKA